MKVIFVADVAGSGQAGDIKEVKNGFARNFLLPKKLAVPATHDHLQRIETIRKKGNEQRIKEQTEINALVENLAGVTVNLSARTGPTGKFYGAVTSTHIAEKLTSITEREFDRRSIQVEQPIQEPGLYEVQLRFSYGISTPLRVVVDPEGQEGSVEAAIAEQAENEASTSESENANDTIIATEEVTDEPAEESATAEDVNETDEGEESSP